MKQYEFKIMNEEMLAEMNELLKGEHGTTLTVWSLECANAAVDGYKNGIVSGVVKGSLLGALVVGASMGGLYLGKKIVGALKKKFQDKTDQEAVEVV